MLFVCDHFRIPAKIPRTANFPRRESGALMFQVTTVQTMMLLKNIFCPSALRHDVCTAVTRLICIITHNGVIMVLSFILYFHMVTNVPENLCNFNYCFFQTQSSPTLAVCNLKFFFSGFDIFVFSNSRYPLILLEKDVRPFPKVC